MRVLLLYPPISTEERYSSSLGSSGGRQIPLGVFYLAAYMRKFGHIVSVIDAEAENLDARTCLNKITLFDPDVLGISTTTVAFHRALEIANMFRAENANKPIVLGGPHVSSNPEHALSFTCFTCGIIGEGEETLREWLEWFEAGKSWHTLHGIAFINADGNVIVNQRRALIEDIDSIPFPAYDLIPDINVYAPPPNNYQTLPVINIITSRGCPNQCTFCDQNVFGRKLRQRSPENIADEIILLHKQYGMREIAFVDDTFTINFSRIEKLFSILQSQSIKKLPWTCMSRVNTVTQEAISKMKKFGCWRIAFGIESGDDTILKNIKKNIDLDRTREVLSWCAKDKIETSGFFIIGHPGDSIETIDKTISFALSLPLTAVIATINTPIPGSEQYANIQNYGTLDKTDWAKFNYWRPVFVPHGLDEKTLLLKHKEFYRRFYFRPHVIWSFFKGFFSRGGMRRFYHLFRSLPYVLFRGKQ